MSLSNRIYRLLPEPVKNVLRRVRRTARRWRRLWSERRVRRSLPPGSEHDWLVFPVIDWAFRFQRPQQLTSGLAREGHRVFYLSTTFGDGDRPTVARARDGVALVQLPGPADFDLYRAPLPEAVLPELVRAIDHLRLELGLKEVVCLVQFPGWRRLVEEARRRWRWTVVYDCMDDHVGFAINAASVGRDEEALVAASDLVTVTSRSLLERWRPVARRIRLLPNATDFAHFHRPAPPPPALRGLTRPLIGYYGAIAEWFDVEMVAAAAAERPRWQFVLVGATTGANVEPLLALPNVHLLGEQPYAALPGYLHAFDVALIPFRRTPLTEATNPVKFYEYLSAGKPVVAVALPELEPYTHLHYPVRSPEELIPQIEAALAEGPETAVPPRLELARGNTWRQRVVELRDAVRELHPKVAIVIVAFAETERLRMCLESLWSRTQYPNFEVVVVDNSGSPQIYQLLRETAEREPRLRVVLSERNEGFPRATNRGIREAGDCEYVALLNDDTVVTHGWLGTLIRHLEEPDVELVGPVTNWAGNEARIEVDYERIEGMAPFAREYTRRRAGQVSEIPMLAMYCVVMRRRLLERIGFLDERFGIGMFEDDDFSRRVRAAGGRVVCAEDVFIHHWGRSSFGALPEEEYRRLFDENLRKFEAKWGEPWRPHVARSAAGEE